jgi:hypothetical protein
MIDFVPFLQKIPTPMRSRGRRLWKNFLDCNGAMIQRVQERIDSGENVPDCLVKILIDCAEEEKLSWVDMCFIANAFTIGGVQSVSPSLYIFINYITQIFRRPDFWGYPIVLSFDAVSS